MPITFEISRKAVLTGNTRPLLITLEGLTASRECWTDFRGQVGFAIDGWNEDPRALFQIPEVRVFWAKFDRQFPAWSFFVQPGELLKSFMLCLVPGVQGRASHRGLVVECERADFTHVVRRTLQAVRSACASRGVPIASYEAYCTALAEFCRRCLEPAA
jgi:hypothetical protein